jgi:hypothetical protein
METKLTLISVSYNGKQISQFVMLPVVNNRCVASQQLINRMLSKLGCTGRGYTYSVS